MSASPDIFTGLEAPSQAEWDAWHRDMLRERVGDYDHPETDFSDGAFRQLFVFMYDRGFYGSGYRTEEMLGRARAMFGRIDSVLLWHAYPRLGFDRRTQFDFYRDMPGGLVRLRAEVSDVCHREGVRVFVDYNPWDEGTYDELGDLVESLDADGVMLDTLTDAPDRLEHAVRRRKEAIVFAPELRPRPEDLGRLRQAWAQWIDVGDGPSILRHRWMWPRHRQFCIRRWDRSRRFDIVYSFFNGSGLLLWENVFGSMNPYSAEDRRLIAETGAVFDAYGPLFVHGRWLPLIPTGVEGLDANRWEWEGRSIVTLRNRTDARLEIRAPHDAFAFWGEGQAVAAGEAVSIEAFGTQALVVDHAAPIRRAFERFVDAGARAERTGSAVPRLARVARVAGAAREERETVVARMEGVPTGFVELPRGRFTMRIRHPRRECGCYPEGGPPDATWGWFYRDVLEHTVETEVARFAMRATAVTNAEFLQFVQDAKYRPTDAEHFLKHLARATDAAAGAGSQAAYPVTFVSLADARAFASFYGQRLPTEAEWQWAAEGAGAGRRYPWGDGERAPSGRLLPAADPASATPQGVMGLSGNTWELTDSEYDDGHTRFVMLRGGVYLPPGESEWLVDRGPRPNDSHAKYILMSDGLDRSATISFRTVMDLE